MRTSRSERVIGYLMLFALATGILGPLMAIILAALNPPGTTLTGFSWPSTFSWDNIATAWTDGHFSSLIWASCKVAIIVVPLTLILAALAGYGLGAMRTPLSRTLSLLFILGMTLPIEVIIVPLYFDLRSLQLTDSLVTVALVESASFLPFGVFWMRTHFASMPKDLTEAATVDGAGPWSLFTRILLPLSMPAITTLGVIYFMWTWNQFLLVLTIISDPSKRTAPAGLGFFVNPHSTDIPLLSAATLIVITPIVIVYLIFQRKFVAGLMQGAFK